MGRVGEPLESERFRQAGDHHSQPSARHREKNNDRQIVDLPASVISMLVS